MDMSLVLAVLGVFLVVLVVAILAVVGGLVLIKRACYMVAQRIAEPFVARERKIGRTRLRRQIEVAGEREAALLAGATTAASGVACTVVQAHIQQWANRETHSQVSMASGD